MAKYKKFLGLGIAGNFALHLAQAGELEEFKDIITADEAAPKGMFPFYLPRSLDMQDGLKLHAKDILTTYPLSSDNITLPPLCRTSKTKFVFIWFYFSNITAHNEQMNVINGLYLFLPII